MTIAQATELFAAQQIAPPALPVPTRQRWQPLRSGLVNLYRYDQQEFVFEQGRMVLRGNNGTGKSRVLALQLPFLLDGAVTPDRVEPDGDPAKRMEWNLLMGRHADRLGYTWLEFGRIDENGENSYVTLGCGLSAVEGRGLVDRWFFITEQRVGESLTFVSPSGTVSNRETLTAVLADKGRVFRTARDYRRAVDEKLFQLGDTRYDALVNLLIQLRQPQLSRTLDEQRLSQALGEALMPLASHVVADVAEAFRSLENDRRVLDDLRSALAAVNLFLPEYQRYVQIAARRRALDVRTHHNAYENGLRKLRAAQAESKELQAESAAAEAGFEQLRTDRHAAGARLAALESGPQMQSAHALERLGRHAEEQRQQAAHAEQDARRSAEQAVAAAQRQQAAEQKRASADVAVAQRLGEAALAAPPAAMDQQQGHALAADVLRHADGPSHARQVQAQLDKTIDDRLRAVQHLEALAAAVAAAGNALAMAAGLQDQTAAQLTTALDQQAAFCDALSAATEALGAAYAVWRETLVELAMPDAATIVQQLLIWQENPEDSGPIGPAVTAAATSAAAEIGGALTEARRQLAQVTAARADLEAQHAAALAGRHEPPPVPYTRDVVQRQTRPGVAFWQACDFQSNFPRQDRPGIEAALEAAGILDAWVLPDGTLLGADGLDTFIIPAQQHPAVNSPTLRDVLMPAIDRTNPRVAEVSEAAVEKILSCIGLGAGSDESQNSVAWVDVTGAWRLGPLSGRWSKAAAEHIGHAAREDARRRRLAELEGQISAAMDEMAQIEARITALDQRNEVARQERATAPDESAMRRAQAAVAEIGRRCQDMQAQLTRAQEQTARHRQAVEAAKERLAQDAADLGLSQFIGNLRGLQDAVHAYRRRLDAFWPAVALAFNAREAAEVSARDAAAAQVAADERHATAAETARHAAATTAEYDTLLAAVGADVQDILRQIDFSRQLVTQLDAQREISINQGRQLAVKLAEVEKDCQAFQETLERATQARGVAIEALVLFSGAGLLTVACPAVEIPADEWSVTQAAEMSREVEDILTNITADDAAWERSQKSIFRLFQELSTSLAPYSYDTGYSTAGNVLVVTVPFQGRTCGMPELHAALSGEMQQRQMILNAREREVLENHLIGEVATHLHDRIHEAQQLVQQMNDELRRRPTSTGMTLRFAWIVREDGPPGLAEARRRLLAAGGTWSPADRRALGEFLQQQIQAVRQANETGAWQEHLTLALDYRHWHTFVVERQQDGQWRRLTRRTHGTGSGGEKAIALTIPQFAAAAAHYKSAASFAPRLILLDEAFVGVDRDMRAKCVGLLDAFDLDFVMTSESEWCCYPTLPGVAIYQFSVRPEIDAVGVTRWVWNGREKVRDDRPILPPRMQHPRSGAGTTLPPLAVHEAPANARGGGDNVSNETQDAFPAPAGDS